jgi:hypothetical protein
MTYQEACHQATIAQGLEAFLNREGWTVEQTGGFTMVATCRIGDGTVWTVTDESEQDDGGYLACRQPVTAWEDSTLWDEAYTNGDVEVHEHLTRAEVFALIEGNPS